MINKDYKPAQGTFEGLCHYFNLIEDLAKTAEISSRCFAYRPICSGAALNTALRSMMWPPWGPLRHGAGHNIVFYFRDYTGSIVEYSAEEEIILNDATYAPRVWPTTDPRAADEWNLSHAPAAMR
jgi:hypothetical protein